MERKQNGVTYSAITGYNRIRPTREAEPKYHNKKEFNTRSMLYTQWKEQRAMRAVRD